MHALKHPVAVKSGWSRVHFAAGVLLLAAASPLASGEIVSGAVPGKSLSLGALSAPAHHPQNGYSFVVKEKSANEQLRDRAESERQVAFYSPPEESLTMLPRAEDVDPEKSPEETGWRGYLSEKGPSHVIVEVEIEQEIKPLSDEIWDLIMGKAPEIDSERERRLGNEVVSVERNAVSIPKVQVDTRGELPSAVVDDPMRIHKEAGDEESPIVDDAAESYQQLMELFNRPVFATPARDYGDAEGMLSFRVPQNTPVPATRDGSSARFEIRR